MQERGVDLVVLDQGIDTSTAKQRVRHLTHDNRTLEDRLEAARSNNRFADRRIPQLEAQLTERAPTR